MQKGRAALPMKRGISLFPVTHRGTTASLSYLACSTTQSGAGRRPRGVHSYSPRPRSSQRCRSWLSPLSPERRNHSLMPVRKRACPTRGVYRLDHSEPSHRALINNSSTVSAFLTHILTSSLVRGVFEACFHPPPPSVLKKNGLGSTGGIWCNVRSAPIAITADHFRTPPPPLQSRNALTETRRKARSLGKVLWVHAMPRSLWIPHQDLVREHDFSRKPSSRPGQVRFSTLRGAVG